MEAYMWFYLRFVFSHSWFATVQDVLHADWQDVWHSPQPLPAIFFNVGFAIVLMFFIICNPPYIIIAVEFLKQIRIADLCNLCNLCIDY
jgi:hypothetical protein